MLLAFLAAAAAALPTAEPLNKGSWFSADDYPAEAMKNHVEGDTTFEVDVNVDGKPTRCRVAKSSGSATLDQATCGVVLRRAQFKPAMHHGRAVVGRYSDRASWRVQDVFAGSGWVATVLDFKDPAHPTCSIEGSNGDPGGLPCKEALAKFSSRAAEDNVTKLALVASFTTGDKPPFAGKPEWGRRVAFAAFELFPPKSGSKPACITVAEEGDLLKGNSCAQYEDGSTLSDAEKRNMNKAHIEQSLFEVERAPAESQVKCKGTGSAAEAKGCV